MSTTLTTKGQVTIPKAVRERLGLKPGSKVEFRINAEGQVIVQGADPANPNHRHRLEKLLGHAGPGMSTDELMKLLRGDEP